MDAKERFEREQQRVAMLPPVVLPRSLNDLRGPLVGEVRLPIHLDWSTNPTYDLNVQRRTSTMYQTVLREALTPEDLEQHVNKRTLLKLWSHMTLPRRTRDTWESAFPNWAGKMLEGFHLRVAQIWQ